MKTEKWINAKTLQNCFRFSPFPTPYSLGKKSLMNSPIPATKGCTCPGGMVQWSRLNWSSVMSFFQQCPGYVDFHHSTVITEQPFLLECVKGYDRASMTFQTLSGAESLIKVKYTDIFSSGHLNPLWTVFHQISGRLVFLKSLGEKKNIGT